MSLALLTGPQTEMLSLLVVAGVLLVGVPTLGIYRDAREHSPRPFAWTGGMCFASVVVPVLGPVAVWLLYTGVEVGR